MSLIDRLRLSKDLALEGVAALDLHASDTAAIRGIVLLDLAFDIAARAALDHLGRSAASSNFPALLDALPELAGDRAALDLLHRFRNSAQHGGIAPPPITRSGLVRDGTRGLELVFSLASSDFQRFSSVDQITSVHLREPLEAALARARTAPGDAVALVTLAFARLRGWAEQLLGDAAIPDEMWVQQTDRWNDVRSMVNCADNRNEFVDALLRVAATTVLKMTVPTWIRLRLLGHGHAARWEADEWRFQHDEDASAVDFSQATWAIEAVARAALALEVDWPEYMLVRTASSATAPERTDEEDSPD
jgi:hypothetical protein